MDQGTQPIREKEHIEDTRQDLNSDLNELVDRVQEAANWRFQYRRRPLLFLAVAFGGGMLLGNVARRRK